VINTADLDAILGDAQRVFLDTSICIAYHSANELAYPLARHLIQRIEDDTDPLAGYISVITAAELLVRPLRSAGHDLVVMHTFLRRLPNLHVIDIDFEVAHQAASIRALTRLALSDALIVATALMSACAVIVTNDEQWSRRLGPLFPQFRWVYLGPELPPAASPASA
jgi:predicted nucleic acid-binding protein